MRRKRQDFSGSQADKVGSGFTSTLCQDGMEWYGWDWIGYGICFSIF